MDRGQRDYKAIEQEKMAKENLVVEKVDGKGDKWRKVYFGGGAHFRNWLEQCQQLGEVEVEEIDSEGFRCFVESGEKLFRIWMKEDTEIRELE